MQASLLYGNTYYLPYAVGMLAAFAFADERVRSSYGLREILYRLDDVDACIERLEDPAFVGFSNSIWNYSYNLVFAEKLKQKYPDCIVEFGGHHVPPTTEFLEKYPFIDVLIHRKGEEAFRDVLIALDKGLPLSDIPNISYREKDGTIRQTPEKTITIADYPSPYLTGVFDRILEEGKYPFSCVLESNRGCPYCCSYCDWGELKSKVRLFPLEKVLAELQWMSDHKMEFVYLVDANFGMFERDEIIAQKLVELKESTGYPNRLQVSYAKNEPERTFRINKLMAEHGIGKGATLSLQSLSEKVLENIGRVNISESQYAAQIARYRDAGISTYTELILGLPGETRESFCRGLCRILELGQHSSVSAYYCELLPNSLLASKEYIEKYRIRTVTTALNQYHCESTEETLSGHSGIIVSTDTMSVADWIDCNVFSTCVQSFHHFGIMQCFAMYANKECGVSYYDFYTALYAYIEAHTTFTKAILEDVTTILRSFTEKKGGLTVLDERFGKITFPLEEAVFLKCHYDADIFYGEMRPFLADCFKDEALLDDMMRYQRAVVLRPGEGAFAQPFAYRFRDYYDAILRNSHVPLERQDVTYRFATPFATADWPEYAKVIIWYGRRNNRMMYSSKPNTIDEI